MLKLRRLYPDDSKWLYAYIAATQLAAEKDLDQPTSGLNRTLAYKALEQAVAKGSTGSGSPGTLSTLRELSLLVEIYRRQGRQEQLLAVLEDANVGVGSSLVKYRWEFVSVKLRTLREQKLWERLWNYCSHIITEALQANPNSDHAHYEFFAADWLVWECLLEATSGLKDEDVTISQRTESLIKQYYDSSASRIRLALLAMATEASASADNSQLLGACKAYLRLYGHLSSCFDDLRVLLETLSRAGRVEFRDFATQVARDAGQSTENESEFKKWSAMELNVLKIDYLLSISTAQNPEKDRLEAFASNCVRLSNFAYIILPLRHQASFRNDIYFKLCYFFSGSLNSIKIPTPPCSFLAIKEFLHDTLGHVLFTRIASQHPFTAHKLNNWDPDESLLQVVHFYTNSQAKLVRFFSEGLDNKEYEKLLELDDLRNRFIMSFQKRSTDIERQRIGRLRGEPVIEDSLGTLNGLEQDLVEGKLVDLKDNRDFSSFPNFECSTGPRFEHYIQNGPKPGNFWLASCLFAEDVHSIINRALPRCRPQPSIISNATESQKSELTTAEWEASLGWALLAPIGMNTLSEELAPQGTVKEIAENLNSDLQRLETWLNKLREAYVSGQYSTSHGLLPVCHELQPMFLHLDVLLACWKLCDSLLQCAKQKSHKLKGKIPKEAIQRIMGIVQDTHARIRKLAADWKNRLSEGGLGVMADQMLEGKVGEAIEQLLGADATVVVEGCAGLIQDAAQDTLDGVLQVKLAKRQG
ncbi:hypothetical protein W97_04260 [Coniosporium apollinis CBS 100218]|uniref:Uncharacterized protein n=1 Tax=Coniosporium apollinis (strain CBS 100218) TaxID=1168221 RepID=R7YT08_CONA1|nr:uncharacterized protein W97_04260 [Coniosporium apollinis CBS 100218]EON65025.1 hypothetical protein W97_04260 [Coniosporium apollinis CBS 100218]